MNPQPVNNGTFNVPVNQKIIIEGEKPDSLKLLLQGKLEAYISPMCGQQGSPDPESPARAGYKLFDVDQNIFIGANELFDGGKSLLTYTAATDCCFYSFPVQNRQDVVELIRKQKEYGAYIIYSISSLILSTYQAYENALSLCRAMDNIYRNLCAYYVTLSNTYGFSRIPGDISDTGGSAISLLNEKGTTIPAAFSRQFAESGETDAPSLIREAAGLQDQVRYYRQLNVFRLT